MSAGLEVERVEAVARSLESRTSHTRWFIGCNLREQLWISSGQGLLIRTLRRLLWSIHNTTKRRFVTAPVMCLSMRNVH
jgi:hypothetical protein